MIPNSDITDEQLNAEILDLEKHVDITGHPSLTYNLAVALRKSRGELAKFCPIEKVPTNYEQMTDEEFQTNLTFLLDNECYDADVMIEVAKRYAVKCKEATEYRRITGIEILQGIKEVESKNDTIISLRSDLAQAQAALVKRVESEAAVRAELEKARRPDGIVVLRWETAENEQFAAMLDQCRLEELEAFNAVSGESFGYKAISRAKIFSALVDAGKELTRLRQENERLTEANEAWHRRIELTKANEGSGLLWKMGER
jgi:hypothetical protein